MIETTTLACQHLDTLIESGEIKGHATVAAIRHICKELRQKDDESYELKKAIDQLTPDQRFQAYIMYLEKERDLFQAIAETNKVYIQKLEINLEKTIMELERK